MKRLFVALAVLLTTFANTPWAGFAQDTPHVLSTLPSQNELNVPISTNISVTFDVDMDETTINDSIFKVNARSTGLHQGAISYNGQDRTATFDPFSDFDEGEVVTVVLTTDIRSSQGIHLHSSYVWSFTVIVTDGTGAFASTSCHTVGDNPESVFAADFDGDGYPDLAIANSSSNNVSVLFNNGAGTFASHVDYPVDDAPKSAFAADLNGDGGLDLATANFGSDNVSVLLNNGAGTFVSDSVYSVGHGPMLVFSADLDGDGDLDLVTANSGSDNVSILSDQELFIRGDYSGDGLVLTNDPLMMLQWIFGYPPGAPPPTCMDAADYNDNGTVLTDDPLMALHYIFGRPASGPPLPPYPDCGPDPTLGDGLDCDWHDYCSGGGKAAAYKPSVSIEDAVNRLMVGQVTPLDGVVRVPVELTLTEAVCGFDISLGYDASSLRFKQVVGGDGHDFYAVDTRKDGVVRIGGVPDIEMAELMGAGTHRVAEIVFTVERKVDVALNWRNVEVYGSNVEPLSVEWVDGVVKAGVGLPKEFVLGQNYPNPFNPTTLIRYDLPVDCQVRLEVYNVVGQRVAMLVDGHQKAGYKVVSWNARDMASGVYTYKLTADSFTSIRKMILLK